MFCLQAMAIPLWATECVKHNNTTITTSAHVNFSRVAQVLCLCLSKQSSSHLARHVSCTVVVVPFAWPPLHIPFALQIKLPHCSATIHDTERRLANWLSRTGLQVASPTISLKWTTTQRLPRSSSTDRAWRRRSILLRASRLLLLNRIWTMSKYGTCWLHHCTYRKEKQVQTDHKFITRTEKTLCQVHLVSEQVRGDLQLRSHKKRKSSQESHSDRDGIPWAHWAVQGENESLSRLSETENHNRLTLEEPRDHQLSEARSEALKQECRADFLDCSIRELQRQIRSSRMEIDHTTLGCETSRRDQARPGCTKNWRSEKEHSEKLSLEVFTKWKNWKEVRKCDLTNSPGKNWVYTSSHRKYTSYEWF